MYVSARQTKVLAKAMATLATPTPALLLRQKLVQLIADLLQADYVASLVWDESAARFRHGVCSLEDREHIVSYQDHFQFEDPIAPQLRPLRFATRVSNVIPQHQLVKSDFFERFLHSGSMYWGLNVFAHNGIHDVGDLRIWRAKRRQDYDDNEVAMLNLLYPSMVQAFNEGLSQPPSPDDSSQAIAALRNKFGLSQREAQVAFGVSCGLADKAIAKNVGIGFTTLRTHLTSALRKIGCANRKELIVAISTARRA
jgi:DNA-binding CsgD family transcriptional regulator